MIIIQRNEAEYLNIVSESTRLELIKTILNDPKGIVKIYMVADKTYMLLEMHGKLFIAEAYLFVDIDNNESFWCTKSDYEYLIRDLEESKITKEQMEDSRFLCRFVKEAIVSDPISDYKEVKVVVYDQYIPLEDAMFFA